MLRALLFFVVEFLAFLFFSPLDPRRLYRRSSIFITPALVVSDLYVKVSSIRIIVRLGRLGFARTPWDLVKFAFFSKENKVWRYFSRFNKNSMENMQKSHYFHVTEPSAVFSFNSKDEFIRTVTRSFVKKKARLDLEDWVKSKDEFSMVPFGHWLRLTRR